MLQTFPPLFFHFFTNKIEETIEIPFWNAEHCRDVSEDQTEFAHGAEK